MMWVVQEGRIQKEEDHRGWLVGVRPARGRGRGARLVRWRWAGELGLGSGLGLGFSEMTPKGWVPAGLGDAHSDDMHLFLLIFTRTNPPPQWPRRYSNHPTNSS